MVLQGILPVIHRIFFLLFFVLASFGSLVLLEVQSPPLAFFSVDFFGIFSAAFGGCLAIKFTISFFMGVTPLLAILPFVITA